jgi:histidinol-phosphatase (PHP family)
LEEKYADKIGIMIGFETEWIRESTETIIKDILTKYAGRFDFFMGSVHHVNTIPIDFDTELYQVARKDVGGTDQKLFLKYFKDQEKMLHALRPPVVGHFDLIRLKSDIPNTQFEGMKDVWEVIQKNLEYINSYGGILELNTSGWRKGLDQAYPCRAICEVRLLCLSCQFDKIHGQCWTSSVWPAIPLLYFVRMSNTDVIM